MEFRQSFWLPPLLAVVILSAYYALVGEPGFPCRTFFLLFLLAAFIAMAVITPLPLFTKEKTSLSFWYPLALASFCALLLLGRFLLAGSIETYGGNEYPHFAYRFPVLGNLIDIFVISLGMRKIAYFSPGYEVILWAGLFIEIVLVSAIIYVMVAYLARQDRRPGSPGIFFVLLLSAVIAIPCHLPGRVCWLFRSVLSGGSKDISHRGMTRELLLSWQFLRDSGFLSFPIG